MLSPLMKRRLRMANEIWTPNSVSLLQSGPPDRPLFHTIYGVIKDGKVYMVRFTNTLSTQGPPNPLVSQ
jgi:hypothetical protein